MKLGPVLILLAGTWCGCAEAQAKNSRYVLIVRDLKGDPADRKDVSLKDAKTSRVLWTRKISDAHPTWSKDRRAVAVSGISRLFVWREGRPVEEFGVPNGRDFLMDLLWSPNKRRLLIGCGSSGMQNYWTLFCLKFSPKGGGKYSPVDGFVTEMKWRGNRTVLYTDFDYDTGKGSGWKMWRAP